MSATVERSSDDGADSIVERFTRAATPWTGPTGDVKSTPLQTTAKGILMRYGNDSVAVTLGDAQVTLSPGSGSADVAALAVDGNVRLQNGCQVTGRVAAGALHASFSPLGGSASANAIEGTAGYKCGDAGFEGGMSVGAGIGVELGVTLGDASGNGLADVCLSGNGKTPIGGAHGKVCIEPEAVADKVKAVVDGDEKARADAKESLIVGALAAPFLGPAAGLLHFAVSASASESPATTP